MKDKNSDQGASRTGIEPSQIPYDLKSSLGRLGGSHELFIDGITGLVVKGSCVEGLTGAIHSVLTDRELAWRLSQSARDYARAELSVERHAERVMSVYEEVIQAL